MLYPPFLKNINLSLAEIDQKKYPFSLPIFCNGISRDSQENLWNLNFTTPVTFFVGENGTGKSTLIEAIAAKCGFNLQGGNRNHFYSEGENNQISYLLASHLRMRWLPKVNKGFFLRAESFFNFSSFIDKTAAEDAKALIPYGGKSLHKQSHGESFFSLFQHKFGYNQREIYFLDEPEAALSPKRQLNFLKILSELTNSGKFQFIIATHSPILMSLPGALLLSFSESGIKPISYQETEHFLRHKIRPARILSIFCIPLIWKLAMS